VPEVAVPVLEIMAVSLGRRGREHQGGCHGDSNEPSIQFVHFHLSI
jgi:hypothetical protein